MAALTAPSEMALSPPTLTIGALFVVALLFRWYLSANTHPITHIRGPPVRSALVGNVRELLYQESVGDLDFKYVKEYGTVWRMQHTFGKQVLVIGDPKALQHIFHKSGYIYPKTVQARILSFNVAGDSILYAPDAEVHSRRRKVMNPAFSAPQLRSFLPLFRKSSAKLCELWKDQVLGEASEGTTIVVNKWLARTTLDIVGEAAFDFDFGALDSKENELSKAYENMFSESNLYPTAWNAVFQACWEYLPERALKLLHHIPTREYTHANHTVDIFKKYARRLVAQKSAELASDKRNKDVMSVLVRANASEDPRSRLSDEEMMAEMNALTLAGHETTANTVTWLLFELARHPGFQDALRAEIVQKRAEVSARGDADLGMDDLESMAYLQAAIKETLRFHCIVYHLNRVASQDDVIPLAYPIVLDNGEVVTEIAVAKGQVVMTNIAVYNRLPEIWGADADEWNPMRYIEGKIDPQVRLGMFSNLMSFSAGVRGCIGWRFSVIEMQAIVTDLIENFKFRLPKDMPEIVRAPVGVMAPMIKGKAYEGIKMPLDVTAV